MMHPSFFNSQNTRQNSGSSATGVLCSCHHSSDVGHLASINYNLTRVRPAVERRRRRRPLHVMAASVVILQSALLLTGHDATVSMPAVDAFEATTTMPSCRKSHRCCTNNWQRTKLHAKISNRLSEDEVSTEIEYAAHSDDDKIFQMDSLLGGSINITSIEEIKDEHVGSVAKVGNGSDKKQVKNDLMKEEPKIRRPLRKTWKRRHARSAEEGIRSETTTGKELSSLLESASAVSSEGESAKRRKTNMARSIAGLIVALAEEAEDLEVEVDARRETPLWGRHVDAIRINFSKLGFAPLRMRGLDRAIQDFEAELGPDDKGDMARSIASEPIFCIDEAFDRIDVDNSGALDEDEIAMALSHAANVQGRKANEVLSGLASRLVSIYDVNGDGVVDREEYQTMVADMAALRQAKHESTEEIVEEENEKMTATQKAWWKPRQLMGKTVGAMKPGKNGDDNSEGKDFSSTVTRNNNTTADIVTTQSQANGKRHESTSLVQSKLESSEDFSDQLPNTIKEGSIVLSDLKLDLRRLLFGLIPGVKTITPGGPLVLEPFTMTVNAQFSPQDILRSNLLDRGLRLLVQTVLRKRIRGIRDLVDGAVFFGRQWNMASKSAPLIEVTELTDIEFDKRTNKFIFTGRVRVRASPDALTIENSFKLRARLGTWDGGKYIGIVDPELALIVECPKAWEKNIKATYQRLGLPEPSPPRPIYTYFPLPLKEKTGYYLGEDNMIKSIYIKDGALKFEISAVVRPGRFLGNHYIAFTVPQRTFIITVERIREGMRVARRNKLAADAAKEKIKKSSRKKVVENYDRVVAKTVSEREMPINLDRAPKVEDEVNPEPKPDPFEGRPGFIGRFVEGYLGANQDDEDAEELDERLASAISDWFGRQRKRPERRSFADRARQQLSDAYEMDLAELRKASSEDNNS